jgi:hypothetical protein
MNLPRATPASEKPVVGKCILKTENEAVDWSHLAQALPNMAMNLLVTQCAGNLLSF